MFCWKCGKKISDFVWYCPNCGAKTRGNAEQEESDQAQSLYTKELEQYSKYQDNGATVDEEKWLIEKAKACNFKSEEILKQIQTREEALQSRIIQENPPSSFEGWFAALWKDKQPDANEKLSEFAADALSSLKHGVDTTVLACWNISERGDDWENKRYLSHLIVSDYYIVLICANRGHPYAIRTKDIRKIEFKEFMGIPAVHFEKFYSDEEDVRPTHCCTPEEKKVLSSFVDKVAQTIAAVRERISFSPEAKNWEEHVRDMNELTVDVVRQKFCQLCWTPDDNWRRKGGKYVSNVLNSACLGKLALEDIILFVDLSTFGNGKTGLTITNSYIMYTGWEMINFKKINLVHVHYKDGALDSDGLYIKTEDGKEHYIRGVLGSLEVYDRIRYFLMNVRMMLI